MSNKNLVKIQAELDRFKRDRDTAIEILKRKFGLEEVTREAVNELLAKLERKANKLGKQIDAKVQSIETDYAELLSRLEADRADDS